MESQLHIDKQHTSKNNFKMQRKQADASDHCDVRLGTATWETPRWLSAEVKLVGCAARSVKAF